MSIKKPRRYQEKAIQNFCDWIERPSEDIATIILATGLGKTFTAACSIAQKPGIKVLWGAHREELIDQAFDALKELLPENIKIEIEMADRRASKDADIVVGTVQTLARNRKNLDGFDPDLIVIDEWHHFHEDNTQYGGLRQKYPGKKILGLTATPWRYSGGDLPLGRKLIEVDIGTGIEHGYLVPIEAETIKTNVSLADVHTQAGDFKINELSEKINVNERNQIIVKRIIQLIREEKRQGILFAADILHSQALYSLLKNEVRTAEIYGTTDKKERRYLMEKMRNGEIDVLTNLGVATEGFDVPHLSFIGLARPTKSLGLYFQMVGRGLRLADGKKNCKLIDVVDKIKTTQSRITYSIMAAAGDIDGSRKRAAKILVEKIPDKLTHFPTFMAPSKKEHWTVDTERWFAPAWIVADNQYVITWSKREERVETNEIEIGPLNFTPSKRTIEKNPLKVYHDIFGEGFANNIIYGNVDHTLNVNFINHGEKLIKLNQLKIAKPKLEKRKLDKPIKRLFYICVHPTEDKARLISLQHDSGDVYKVMGDMLADTTTVDEMIKVQAAQDDMSVIVDARAKWRSKLASVKQQDVIKNFMKWGKIEDDLDVASLTGGDASTVMDEVSWKEPLIKLFGAKDKKQLIGYNLESDDV